MATKNDIHGMPTLGNCFGTAGIVHLRPERPEPMSRDYAASDDYSPELREMMNRVRERMAKD